ncbi:Amino acid transporter, transmembrane domain containing protein [Parasponia andersonii]|uniref:Amino acid transporter, transmembrane domain containing protein n=1 Tax=Parasponia andersonii TaxID=3476 RepID=A0A2P5CI14_PARAD|nr:Amino acid transporter, transmembrane domain containing protein [Parasponia andersonii]
MGSEHDEVTPNSMISNSGFLVCELENGVLKGAPPPKEYGAGALSVLEPRGSWLHCGYHLTTSIVSPALLCLPSALAMLGWVGGVLCMTFAGVITFYAYILLSVVLEHHAHLGRPQFRFRDMATDILGPGWGKYFVGPLQLGLCYSVVVAFTLLGGQSLKFIYLLSNPTGTMKLYNFTIIFGALMLFLVQIPSLHSLRHINLVSLNLCLAFSVCVTIGSIYIGNCELGFKKNNTIMEGQGSQSILAAFFAISIVATTFSSGVFPQIQATIAPPVKTNMFKGICISYSVIVSTYYSVAISGYWAFGNRSKGSVLANFIGDDHKPLLPTWFLLITNLFILLQVSAATLVYLQPTNQLLEEKFIDPKSDQFSGPNIVRRLFLRLISVIIATTLAAMLPFFGDLMALFGAFGCIPLDFILPFIFYNLTFKPSNRSFIFWVNTLIAVICLFMAGIGAIASLYKILSDAKMFRLFPNM